MESTPVTIVLAEDHAVLRELFLEHLAEDVGIEVVGAASDGREAIAAVLKHRPDVAVLDIGLPSRSGIEAADDLRAFGWSGPILFLTGYDDDATIAAAARAGAHGLVSKVAGLAQLATAIRAAKAGESCVEPRHRAVWESARSAETPTDAETIVRRAMRGDREAVAALASPVVRRALGDREDTANPHEYLRTRFASLSEREATVLRHLIAGHTADLTAELESVSVATVRTQIRAVLQKLGVHSQLAAVALARRASWPEDLTVHALDPDEIVGQGTYVVDPAPRGAGSDQRTTSATTDGRSVTSS